MFISLNNAEKNEASLIIKNKFQYLILFPGGNWKPKIWPDYYFNNLIHLLISRFSNLKFIIVGSLEEKKMYFNVFDGRCKEFDKDHMLEMEMECSESMS